MGCVSGCGCTTRKSEPHSLANLGASVWASGPELFLAWKDGVSAFRTPPGIRETRNKKKCRCNSVKPYVTTLSSSLHFYTYRVLDRAGLVFDAGKGCLAECMKLAVQRP
jgi:hypothetical protein